MKSAFNLVADIDNYCVMGNPVAQSKSPQIHKIFAERTAQDMFYQAILVEPGCFAEAMREFRQQGGKGLNVTVPFKADACAEVDYLTERSEKANAVNTIWFDENDESYGDTTDGIGLVKDLSVNEIHLQDKRVLMLGAGGAVRGVLGALLDKNVKNITLANRTHAKAKELAANYSKDGNVFACEYDKLEPGSFDLIINGTSASLHGELPPLPKEIVVNSCCYDMVYSNDETAFVKWSRDNGSSKAIDGLGMLVEQAAESFYIWRGVFPETDKIVDRLKNKN